jgi:ferredoxin
MIVARKKPITEILSMIQGYRSILTVGCGTCVAVCLAGGEKEVEVLNNELALVRGIGENPVEATGFTVERQCDMEFLENVDVLAEKTEAILSMACGAGIQFIAERYPDIPVYPAVDTVFIGVNKGVGEYEERCRSCGNCVLDITGGICPVTMCAKGLFNGPCGGTDEGMCEVDSGRPCAWYQIYERLFAQGRLDEMKRLVPSRGWDDRKPRSVRLAEYEKK